MKGIDQYVDQMVSHMGMIVSYELLGASYETIFILRTNSETGLVRHEIIFISENTSFSNKFS